MVQYKGIKKDRKGIKMKHDSIIYTNSMALGYDKKLFRSVYQARKTLKESGFKLTRSLWSSVDLDMNILNFREFCKGTTRLLLVERIKI